ncbi:TolC family outer membrane protein [Sphingomonas sp. MMS24-J13]|uniref:TolC family outer membrane protein n=1 Tax=Sphingomonas sp. MMS24-J13 TaxID=3238686 RepID=UPI00384B2E43
MAIFTHAAGRTAIRLLGLGILTIATSDGSAETLAEAIASAYQSNPTLQAQRAQLRATDETYVQARSGYGPTLQVQASANYNQDRLRDSFSGDVPLAATTTRSNLGRAEVVVDQPLYTGGRTALAVHGAEERIRAAREALRATEQNMVLSVIQAYLDVRRDLQALDVRHANLDALNLQLKETRARQRAGEVTQTDVAQAQAQVFAEEAGVALAENQLRASRTEYTTVVGHMPGDLSPEPPLPGVPGSSDLAFKIAADASPEFQQALFAEQVSRNDVRIARAGERPTITLRGTYGYSTTLDPFNQRNRDRALTGQAILSIPIFSSGRLSSEIRQALEVNGSDRLSIEAARRTMVQNVANAWNELVTYTANIDRQSSQVDAAAIAFKGMRLEYRAGERSTLDVLVAEETLRDAELAKLSAQHDAALAAALVLRYIGRLDARDIVAGIPAYDPAAHLKKVENKGALPVERVVRALDGSFKPGVGSKPLPAPSSAPHPVVAVPQDQPVLAPVTTVPIAPVPGTISNVSGQPIDN